VELYREADARFNSGLFHFDSTEDLAEPADSFTPGLAIDDKLLKEIIGGLYYPESPYVFSVFPADILGQVYEQFLGKVIRLTAGHQAKVEDKPEVKKAGGVFYTPTYIVDYIVRGTLGKLLEGKTPRQAAGAVDGRPLRLADPACGSGSFLIGAYQYLLDWHRDWYVEHLVPLLAAGKSAASPEVGALLPVHPERRRSERGRRSARDGDAPSPIFQGPGGAWRLTTAERKRILLAHIFGVDVDAQAVEVTKMSLLLKVLEGENAGTLSAQLSLFKERALPDLGDNIKCGNSLVGPDFYNDPQMSLLPADEQYRVNAFDWRTGFPQVFSGPEPGFDAVIGNPPYIRIQTMKEWAPREVEYYKKRYRAAGKGNYDIYVVFVEKGLSLLNKQGRLGFILPHKFFNAQYGQPLREIISQGQHLSKVVHFGDQQVFENATTYTCLMFLARQPCDQIPVVKVVNLEAWRTDGQAVAGIVQSSRITASEWNLSIGNGGDLFDKLGRMPVKLGHVADRIAQGIRTSANEVYVLDLITDDGDLLTARSELLGEDIQLERAAVSLFLQGREIKSYRLLPGRKVVIMPYSLVDGRAQLIPERELRGRFPKTYAYLLRNKSYLEDRERGRMVGPNWYAYTRLQNIDVMKKKKILVPDIADRACYAWDENGNYAFTSGYAITLRASVAESPAYVLGLLNSSVLNFYLKQVSTQMRGGFFRYFSQFLEQLPIRKIDFSVPADKARFDRMVALVERILALHRQAAEARTDQEKAVAQRQIEATDRQIDRLVYELYGLSEVEVAIVEGRE